MEIIQWCKMQIMCLLILVYIGYPKGLRGTQIPLCARIMGVADVFDALSAKRCYRDAMPVEECYRIISDGREEDFDPEIVDAFLSDKSKIERILYASVNGESISVSNN